MSTLGPPGSAEGLVYRYKIPVSGNWELHNSFAYSLKASLIGFAVYTGPSDMSSSTVVVPRESWTGHSPIDVSAFIQSYTNDRQIIRPLGQGFDMGLLESDSFVYFVYDNWDTWANDSTVIRFRLTCSPA
eukprot:5281183-Pleurochrysis_carterae.AAC.1